MIDCVDDIIKLREVEFFDIATGYQVIDRAAVAFWINRENAFAQHFNLGAPDAVGQGMQLSIAIADLDVVVIDQRNVTDPRTRASLGRPGTDSTDADNAKMRLLQWLKRGLAKNSRQARKTLLVIFA